MEFWSDFWDIIWWFVWAFVFIAYLFALFSIITDLFRDRELSGWWKAVWLIFLLVLPFVTALVYLIARGRGMAERSARSAVAARRAGDAYIRDVAGSASPGQQIAQAKALLDEGAISSEEFAALKDHALRRAPGTRLRPARAGRRPGLRSRAPAGPGAAGRPHRSARPARAGPPPGTPAPRAPRTRTRTPSAASRPCARAR